MAKKPVPTRAERMKQKQLVKENKFGRVLARHFADVALEVAGDKRLRNRAKAKRKAA